MFVIEVFEQFQVGQFVGVLFLVFEIGQDLVFDVCQSVFGEGWLVDYLFEQFQCLGLFVGIGQVVQVGYCYVVVGVVVE